MLNTVLSNISDRQDSRERTPLREEPKNVSGFGKTSNICKKIFGTLKLNMISFQSTTVRTSYHQAMESEVESGVIGEARFAMDDSVRTSKWDLEMKNKLVHAQSQTSLVSFR